MVIILEKLDKVRTEPREINVSQFVEPAEEIRAEIQKTPVRICFEPKRLQIYIGGRRVVDYDRRKMDFPIPTSRFGLAGKILDVVLEIQEISAQNKNGDKERPPESDPYHTPGNHRVIIWDVFKKTRQPCLRGNGKKLGSLQEDKYFPPNLCKRHMLRATAETNGYPVIRTYFNGDARERCIALVPVVGFYQGPCRRIC